MRLYLNILFILITLSLSAKSITPRIAELESNNEYMSLLKQEKQLLSRQDSIQTEITSVRSKFSTASEQERRSLGQSILRLEGELFEMRNQAGIITSKINNIEQEFIINQLNNKSTATQPTTTPITSINQEYSPSLLPMETPLFVNLFSNVYFTDNLSATDMRAVRKTLRMEHRLEDLKDKYLSNYKNLQLLRSSYAATDNQYSADTIIRMFNTVKSLNMVVQDSIQVLADYIFENRVYTYNYLYEKMGDSKLLSDLERALNRMRNKLAAKPDSLSSDILFELPYRQLLLCEQEIILADKLNFSAAADSLKQVRNNLLKQDYALQEINITERIFIDYAPIEVSKTLPYNSKNPIPEMVHYMKGTVYRVLLGSYVRAQPTTIFRNIKPLCVDIVNKRYNYYAGAFATEEEAVAAVAMLKKRGFRRPEVVVWVDDVYEKLSEANITSKAKTEAHKIFYRVEITMLAEGEGLSELHKQTINSTAPGKELSRGFLPDGRAVFTVGSFAERNDAEQLAVAMNAVGGCMAQIVQLK